MTALRYHAVVVEDEPQIRRFLRTVLPGEGEPPRTAFGVQPEGVDHGGEPAYHPASDHVVEQLERLSADAQPVIASLAAAEPRLARYGPRLTDAATRVALGDNKQFTGVMCESFHDVWMELHEDLIVLQRIDRTHEGSF